MRCLDRSIPHVALATVCLLLSPAGDAAARKFQMSGTWIYRNGQVFLPLQFAAAAIDGTRVVHSSMGNLTGAFLVPNAPIPGGGGVSATGSAPATLRIPPHRFVEDAMALAPFSDPNLIQLTTNIGIDAPYAAATLAPGGGPGSFTWCPGDPGCVAGAGMLSTDPPQGAGPRNGRVIYRAGGNRFGGVMQLGLRRGGRVAVRFTPPPPQQAFLVAHFYFQGVGTATIAQAGGNAGSADAPAKRVAYRPRGFVTRPTMVPAPGSPILYPGPKVNTMFTTYKPYFPILYFPAIATGPMGTLASAVTTQYGFAHTTGTVIVQQHLGTAGEDFFTVMGTDGRTPLGAGNLSLVAGGLTFRRNLASPTVGVPYGSFDKVTLTLAPPIPSLSPPGVAAAAALVLLAAGWALRRRFA